jgi:Lar family restriction alleviation protein
MSEKLKPCPFCGCTELDVWRYGTLENWEKTPVERSPLFAVTCTRCRTGSIGRQFTADKAIESWNTRPIEDELEAYADKLAAGLPDGMLPKDVENLRQANISMAQQIHELKAAARWTPVGERLPEKGVWVLVVYDDGEVRNAKLDRANWVSLDREKSVLWFIVHEVYGGAIHYRNNPTHWRPLPEPPMEDKQE